MQIKLRDSIQTPVMNGTAFTVGLTLSPGSNTIELTATDLAGNPSSQKRSIFYDDQKPSLAITLPSQNLRTNQSSLPVSGTASDPYTAVGITLAMDGNILTPAVIGDIFPRSSPLQKRNSIRYANCHRHKRSGNADLGAAECHLR